MTDKGKEDIFASADQFESQNSSIDLPKPGSQERLRAERQLIRRLDTRVLPVVFIITIMNYIDVCSFATPDLPNG